MKSSISEFCVEFSEVLFPLAEALGDTLKATEVLTGDRAGSIGKGLSNARHRLEALINKVQGQEAYVLLFGPLKSGKSTLINAISGAYVSEVSSLPAYPCMVYLKYAPEPDFSVTRYSGKTENLESAEAVKNLLETSHRTLSERIRAMDDFGENFDPASHLPSAIRRVSVNLPVEGLRESGTVLVDTPGLYSKMKFGYDYMTREFRDSAACAVFIVKTDNLFLEQVFSDFNDLLDQFSRVFVVVNIDTGKSDLCPDGSLEPSLESREPDEIVKAFEVLTMSAPLRRAADNGRLHIYPIDLRSAAARRLRAEADEAETGQPKSTAGTSPAEPDQAETGKAEPGRAEPGQAEPDQAEPDRFDSFLSDLMNYLNSIDYLMEFISDSIRQSAKLCDEVGQECSSGKVDKLRAHRDELDRELDACRARAAAAARVLAIEWPEVLGEPLERLQHQRTEAAGAQLSALDDRVLALAGEWLQSDESVQQLAGRVQEALTETMADFSSVAVEGLRQLSGSAFGGAALEASAADDLQTIGLDIGAIVKQAASVLQVEPFKVESMPDLHQIPVQRTLGDKLLFRSAGAVRNRVLADPDQPLTAAVKQKRLGEQSAEYIRAAAADALRAALEKAEQEHCQAATRSYPASLKELVGQRITELAGTLKSRISSLQTEQSGLDAVASQLETLAGITHGIRTKIDGLEDTHQQTVRQLKAGELTDYNAGPVVELEAEPVDRAAG